MQFKSAPFKSALVKSALVKSAPVKSALVKSVLVAAALLAGRSFATPVNYSESVSGDLPLATPLTTFAFDLGVNTVSGATSYVGPSNPASIDFDPFAFTVPAGMQISSIQLDMTESFGNIVGSTWRVRQGSTVLNAGTLLESLVVDPTGSALATSTPLPGDAYNFAHGSVARAVSQGVGVDSGATYTFTFTIVPEPSSACLLAAAPSLLRRQRRTMR